MQSPTYPASFQSKLNNGSGYLGDNIRLHPNGDLELTMDITANNNSNNNNNNSHSNNITNNYNGMSADNEAMIGEWQQSVDMQSVPSTTSFQDPAGNAGTCFEFPSERDFAQQADAWSLNNSLTGSPQNTDGGGGPNFVAAAGAVFQDMPQPHTSHNNAFSTSLNQQPVAAGPSHGTNINWSASPPTARKDSMHGQSQSKQLVSGQKALLAANGVRKRNARYEIPKEITLETVDAFLAASPNEQTTAFLKASKRLLRNRQAALDSRQRKRQHTERLETEKKEFNSVVGSLEAQTHDLANQLRQVLGEKNNMEMRFNMEKEDMIAAHTRETGELRKKIDILTQHIQQLESSQTSGGGNGTDAFGHSHDSMDAMDMSYGWAGLDFMNDFSQPHPNLQPMPMVPIKEEEPTLHTPTTVANSNNNNNTSTVNNSNGNDKSAAQGGLLFMLFLVGAFVMSSRSPPSIPPVSEEMRAASAALLENVLKDAGVDYPTPSLSSIVPHASGVNWQGASAGMAGSSDSVEPSMLLSPRTHVGMPTEEQRKEEAFSLSAMQYSGVSGHDFVSMTHQQNPTGESLGRKNLATAIDEIRSASRQSGAAEVYTRTLLWDKIPNEVIKDFAKMVVDGNGNQQ